MELSSFLIRLHLPPLALTSDPPRLLALSEVGNCVGTPQKTRMCLSVVSCASLWAESKSMNML